MNFVVGAKGRLGRVIVNTPSFQAIALNRPVYANWWRTGSADAVSRFFERYSNEEQEARVIYVCAGILDPSLAMDEHHQINFLLAKHIVEGASKLGWRVLTFGTIMEKVIGLDTSNPYILTKTKLSEFIREYSIKTRNTPPLHIRLHTLYGAGLPSPFMFLGQVLDAIAKQISFEMSSGNQLREYHHINDELKAISTLVAAKINGIIELNHGNPLTLKEIATYLFKEFNCLELLKIGSASTPLKENYDLVFERPPLLSQLTFRETLPGLVNYLHLCKENHGELLCLN